MPVDQPSPQTVAPCPLGVCVLASGSKGNAIYIGDGRTAILIDAGLSGIEIERRMRGAGLDPQYLSAIVVSHEHDDHIRGVGVLSRRFNLPVYISERTAAAADRQLGRLHQRLFFETGRSFAIGDLSIHPFTTSHDAEDPAGFTISRNGCKVGIATDLGIATGMVKHHLKACSLLILEANHDEAMLIEGPYPWPLKQRIRGRSGHLSNDDSCRLLSELKHDGLCHVILAHLSEINNTPAKALETACRALAGADDACAARFHVACQDRCTELLLLE